jgi:hypothetical protein
VVASQGTTKKEQMDEPRYVAYCDILGFSNRIETDFDSALGAYRQFVELMADESFVFAEVHTTMYSDAVLVTGTSLPHVLRAIQNLWFLSLMHNFMIRGAITHGRYWEERTGGHLFVVSDALVRAVKLERSVGVPVVIIADDVEIPDSYWAARFSDPTHGQYITPLLHFRDRNIVNPFNLMWHRSAGDRAKMLLDEHPRHKDKYLWFLALHRAVGDGEALIPQSVLARLIQESVKRNEALKSVESPPPAPPASD